MPAKAGIQKFFEGIPASAGMTGSATRKPRSVGGELHKKAETDFYEVVKA